jgi:Rrf2 family transcriptional regulator, nitric oxide-sensitive transcriptional repressor
MGFSLKFLGLKVWIMNKINRKLEYALVALKHMGLKRTQALSTVKEICQIYGCPFDATSRVMQSMAQRSLLKSEQGAYGGYYIACDLHRVSLHDLIEVVLGPVGIAKCLSQGISDCEIATTCNVTAPVLFLNNKLIEFYKSISLYEVLGAQPAATQTAETQTTAVITAAVITA